MTSFRVPSSLWPPAQKLYFTKFKSQVKNSAFAFSNLVTLLFLSSFIYSIAQRS